MALDEARRDSHRARESMHGLMLKVEAQRSSQALKNQNLTVIKGQIEEASAKILELEAQLRNRDEPLDEKKKTLEGLLDSRVEIEKSLTEKRVATENDGSTDQDIRDKTTSA
jgi:hypothetical protein